MPLTKIHNRMIQGDTIHVDDFGADPTGVADSTAAIQAAVDYAQSFVTGAVDSIGDVVNGATVVFRGVYKVSEPIRVSESNVCLEGQGGTTIYPYFTSSTGYNGAKPVFIIGSAEQWQSSGLITGAKKYNRCTGINIKRVDGYNAFIGWLISGTRNCIVSDSLVERGFAGLILENTSEFYSEQVSVIGCTYGIVMDNRGGRDAFESVLNVANVDNDVSANKINQVTIYYAQHTAVLAINAGSTDINGATFGVFSDNPSASSPGLGFPAEHAGVHIWGSDSKWTRAMLIDNVVFEAKQDASRDCIRVESTTANNPILGVTVNNAHVQTYASDPATGTLTVLMKAVQSGAGDIHNVVLRDSGFTYQSGGYYTGMMADVIGNAGILFDNCYPTSAFNLGNFGYNGVFKDINVYEHVDLDALPPTGWTAVGNTFASGKTGGSSGVLPYLEFTGDAGAIYIQKDFDYLPDTPEVKSAFISFLGYGDADLHCVSRVNGQPDSDSNIVNATNIGRYGQAIWPNNVNVNGYRRIVFCFNPINASYGFNTVQYQIGKKASSPTELVRIADIKVGYFVGSVVPYNPF